MFHDSGLARLDLEGFATLVSLRTLAESLFGAHHGLAIPLWNLESLLLIMAVTITGGTQRNTMYVFKNVQCKYMGVVQNFWFPKTALTPRFRDPFVRRIGTGNYDHVLLCIFCINSHMVVVRPFSNLSPRFGDLSPLQQKHTSMSALIPRDRWTLANQVCPANFAWSSPGWLSKLV